MEIKIIYDFVGGFGFANSINFECFDKEKYKIDFYKSYGDSFDYFYNKNNNTILVNNKWIKK